MILHTILSSNPDEVRLQISSLVPVKYYDERLAKLRDYLGSCTPKVPNYETWLNNIVAEASEINDATYATSYHVLPLIIMEHEGIILPLMFLRDEQVHDAHVVIPVIPFEQYCYHNYWLWLCGISTDILVEFGLEINEAGIRNPLVNLVDLSPLRRFKRYYKNVETVNVITDINLVKEKLRYYTPLALEYWKSQGVYAQICDNLDMYTGGGETAIDLLAVEVLQKTGESGIGIFTIFETGELYWDYSRRTTGNHIGNNILYAACLLAAERGLSCLNLGVGYYQWKDLWSGGNFKQLPGLTCIENSILSIFRDRLIDQYRVPLSTGFNKERTSA